jgi:hypothetical protein
MAVLGRWTGGSVAILPTTAWTAPANLFPTEQRNDSSAYSFASASSSLTLPSSDLPDGFLVIGRFEFEDTSNGRHNPQGRFVQTSGSGNFAGSPTGGYNRDTSEDRSYVSCWAFIDSPSASSVLQFQWKRDADTPTGGTVRSSIDVIPFYYSDIGLYSSTDAALLGGVTPHIVSSWSTIAEGANITRSGDVVTAAGDNKRYLVLGSQFYEGRGGRTQRWMGIDVDGAQENAAKSYAYYRNGSNDESGNMFTHLFETDTADVTIEHNCYRGDGVGAGQGGADIDGSTPAVGDHTLVVIELNDSAEVFHSVDDLGGIDLNVTGPVDQTIARTTGITIEDTASFSRASDTAFDAVVAMDALLGANISAAQEIVSTTSRWTAQGRPTVNGTEDNDVFHGNYARNNQGSQDTFGWSANFMGFVALAANDEIGASVQELPGGEDGGQYEVQPGWAGFWGVNLDTLEDAGSAANLSSSQSEDGDVTSSILSSLVSLSSATSESGDNTGAAIESPSAISAASQELGDATLSDFGVITSLSGSLSESGDISLASISTAQTAEISSSQLELGDSSSAQLLSVVGVFASLSEVGDSSSASLEVLVALSASQSDDGDLTAATISTSQTASVSASQLELGDATTSSFASQAQLSSFLPESGDSQLSELAIIGSIQSGLFEEGDITFAAIEAEQKANLSAIVVEGGDSVSAFLSLVTEFSANQLETGDSQSADLSQPSNLVANAVEFGDIQSSSLRAINEIAANLLETGDSQSAAIEAETGRRLFSNQFEVGDATSASIQPFPSIAAIQNESGDTTRAAFGRANLSFTVVGLIDETGEGVKGKIVLSGQSVTGDIDESFGALGEINDLPLLTKGKILSAGESVEGEISDTFGIMGDISDDPLLVRGKIFKDGQALEG